MKYSRPLATGIGKRKTAMARVYVAAGTGNLYVNGKSFQNFAKSYKLEKETIKDALKVVRGLNKYNIQINVRGGGLMGKISAIRLAVGKAMLKLHRIYKIFLYKKKLITTDSRIKESRKYGLKKARKAPQFTKR